MEANKRRETELNSYHVLKETKDNLDILYLVDQGWLSKWIEYLKGTDDSPDYINNERLYRMIFEEHNSKALRMNEDFIMVHKSLFEYLYGIYGCDYFI